MDNFTKFVLEHGNEDPAKLILSKDKWPDIDVPLAASTIEGRERMKGKVPQWWEEASLVYPNTLCTQMCSSSETAFLKASVVKGLGIRSISDLTGGLGVDAWAFSKVADLVLFNDADPALYNAAKHNFPILGIDTAIKNVLVGRDSVSSLLEGYSPDAVFLDPARRDTSGKKVFLLEQCSPDVTSFQDILLEKSPFLVLKLSPMADIPMVASRLKNLKEIHIIGSKGECKELLSVSQRGWEEDYGIFVHEGDATLQIPKNEAPCPLLHSAIKGGDLLFVPGKTLSKAIGTGFLPESSGMEKIAPSTNLYIVRDEKETSLWKNFGKMMRVTDTLPYSGKAAKILGKKYPEAAVSARNVPFSSETLRAKTSCSGNGPYHIYAFTGPNGERLILAASPLQNG